MATKTKKATFTFKKDKPETGLRGVGRPHQNVEIKRNKMWVGTIYAPSWSSVDDKWGLAFIVKGYGSNPNCDWHWHSIPIRFGSEDEARRYVRDHAEEIVALDLHELGPSTD